MIVQAGTLDNVTKTIGRLLDGYDIRLRPNFGGECLSSSLNHIFRSLITKFGSVFNTDHWEPGFITGK